ncbi:MAG: hypothetical protein RL095_1359 [Verrucomicrobiota bacterium]|jgi:predicted RNA-binding protein with PUA-like domain
MASWLFKSEPDVFSIDDLEKRLREPWNGVRNYQARNWLRDSVQEGDEIFFYHSSCPEPGIYGRMRCSRKGHPDASQFDPASEFYDAAAKPEAPRWYQVEVEFLERWKQPVLLPRLKACDALAELALVRPGNRLSIMPVAEAEAVAIKALRQL